MNKEVLDYIRANRNTYTHEAIDAKLRDEGHADADIQAAWKAIRDEDALVEKVARARANEQQVSDPRRTSSSSTADGCLTSALMAAFALGGLILILLTNLGLALRSGYSSSGPTSIVPLQWFVNLGSLVVVIALAAGASWLSNTKRWSGGQVTALVSAVILFWYLVLVGTCLYGPTTLG